MADLIVGHAGANRTIKDVTYRDGSTTRVIKEVWIGDGGTKRQVYSAYTPISNVVVSPSPVTGSAFKPPSDPPPTKTVTSEVVNVTWSGGNTSGVTVTWTKVSGETMLTVPSAGTPSGSSGQFSAPVNVDSSVTAVYRVTVSDGKSSAYKDVSITLSYP